MHMTNIQGTANKEFKGWFFLAPNEDTTPRRTKSLCLRDKMPFLGLSYV